MQNSVSFIGLTFDIASVGLDTNTKLNNLLDYRNVVCDSLIEESSKPDPCKSLIILYTNSISASESILQSLTK